MRKVILFVQASLDGIVAGPEGEVEPLVDPQDETVREFLAGVDTVLLGTAAYDYMLAQGVKAYSGKELYVFSRTLSPREHPHVTLVPTDPRPFVSRLKAREGGDIGLLVGGVVFRYLLMAGLVDEVVVLMQPLLVGFGAPLLPRCERSTALELIESVSLPRGAVRLRYRVEPRPAA